MGICVVHLTTNFQIKYYTSLVYNIYTLLCTVIFNKMDERKQKLITALESEKERLDKLGVDTHDHFITIDYLKTGSYGCDPTEVEDYPLLDAALNDYDCLLSDYGA